MSERYSRVFVLPENLYAVGSPVVIAAGTLLKDNQTGRIVAQLKFRSISDKIIKAVKVRLDLFDTAGSPIAESVVFDFLDLSASRDTEFGQKTPVSVAESKARSYTVAVQEVVFADKTTWSAIDTPWESLPRQKTLNAVFSDSELVKQYRIALGSDCAYYPLDEKDIWYCTCGALNHADESCNACHRTMFELRSIDLEQLAKDRDTRLAQEAKRAAEEKAVAEIQKQKNRKILRIVIPVLCAVIAVALLVTTVIIPNGKYNDAVALMDAGKYEDAIAAFEAMNGYKDSSDRIKACETAILDGKYNEAVVLMDAGEYEAAIAAFEALGDYEDSSKRITDCNTAIVEANRVAAYEKAEALVNSGELAKAAIEFGKLGNYRDARQRSLSLWRECIKPKSISAGVYHTVGLKENGTVVAVGSTHYGKCDVSAWTDIVDIEAEQNHTIALRDNGTVVFAGWNNEGQCNVSNWSNISAISTSFYNTIGLKSDGTVVAVGDNKFGQRNVSSWVDIVAISAGSQYTVGIKCDGTVVAVGKNDYGQCKVDAWADIVAISTGYNHTIGLKADGTVVAVGENNEGQCNVSGWTDIVAISAGTDYTVGLKADGTVVFAGENDKDQCNVSSWTNIVAIDAHFWHTVGLKSDGTVVAVGYNKDSQCDVSGWKNIKLPN